VDATHSVEITYTVPDGVGFPIAGIVLEFFFGSDNLGSGESLALQAFDANHILIRDILFINGGSPQNSFLFGSLDFNPQLTTSTFSVVLSTFGPSSFDVISASAETDSDIPLPPGSFTAPVPAPVVGAGLPGLLLAALGMIGWRGRR
jgi:hypothetical protein